MKTLFRALAALPLLTGAALAQQPTKLSDQQMDSVTAGFMEVDLSNTSATGVSIFRRDWLTEPTSNFIACSTCYLVISTTTLSVASQFGSGGVSFIFPPE